MYTTDLAAVEGEEIGGVESSGLALPNRSGVEEDCLAGDRPSGKLNWLSGWSGPATGVVWTLRYRERGRYIACRSLSLSNCRK